MFLRFVSAEPRTARQLTGSTRNVEPRDLRFRPERAGVAFRRVAACPPAGNQRIRAPIGARVCFCVLDPVVARSGLAAFVRWTNRSDHVATVRIRLLIPVGENLIRNFASVDFHRAWEVKRDAHAITLDRHDANNTHRGRWITDDDFFTLAACNDEHVGDLLPRRWPVCHMADSERLTDQPSGRKREHESFEAQFLPTQEFRTRRGRFAGWGVRFKAGSKRDQSGIERRFRHALGSVSNASLRVGSAASLKRG